MRTAKPLDIRVPGFAQVVAITGPNTGGKTVTLKTAGLLALMAKSGLFLPCDRQELAAAAAAAATAGETGSSGSNGLHDQQQQQQQQCQPRLRWFDQVLADIGDSQSLQQNLSTFSGHIARLRLLLGAAGSESLVLLDEVGSGTDPLVSPVWVVGGGGERSLLCGRAWVCVRGWGHGGFSRGSACVLMHAQ